MLVRLQKYLADCGVASRRRAEGMIAGGRVRLNGRRVTEMGVKCDPATDRVEVDDKPVRPAENFSYVLYNKPRGVTSTLRDRHAETTLVDALAPRYQRLKPVGRLDKWSEGLLLLTDHGELINRLTHPRFKQQKVYWVEVNGVLRKRALGRLERGVHLGRDMVRAIKVEPLTETAETAAFELTLGEGRKRQVRRMCEEVGFKVRRLRRVAMGPLKLGRLASSHCRDLTSAEVKSLLKAVELD